MQAQPKSTHRWCWSRDPGQHVRLPHPDWHLVGLLNLAGERFGRGGLGCLHRRCHRDPGFIFLHEQNRNRFFIRLHRHGEHRLIHQDGPAGILRL